MRRVVGLVALCCLCCIRVWVSGHGPGVCFSDTLIYIASHDTDIKGSLVVWVHAWWSSVRCPGAIGRNPSKCSHTLPMKWTFQGQLWPTSLRKYFPPLVSLFLLFQCAITWALRRQSTKAFDLVFHPYRLEMSKDNMRCLKCCQGRADWRRTLTRLFRAAVIWHFCFAISRGEKKKSRKHICPHNSGQAKVRNHFRC